MREFQFKMSTLKRDKNVRKHCFQYLQLFPGLGVIEVRNCQENKNQPARLFECSQYKVTTANYKIIYFPPGQGIGGKRKGALTDKAIKYLTHKYSNAIYTGKTATLKHCWSTDNTRHHDDCPESIAKGDIDPFQHKTRVGTPLDKERLEEHLVPVYERLTDPNLLARYAA